MSMNVCTQSTLCLKIISLYCVAGTELPSRNVMRVCFDIYLWMCRGSGVADVATNMWLPVFHLLLLPVQHNTYLNGRETEMFTRMYCITLSASGQWRSGITCCRHVISGPHYVTWTRVRQGGGAILWSADSSHCK